jgi:glycosyltransferase involved in cell wall biosynthesis
VEYGWVFKEKDKPLYVSLLHNVFDKTYKENITFKQSIYYNFILRPNIYKSLKTATRAIAISKYTKDSFVEEYSYKNIDVIYPSIDTDKFKPKKIMNSDKRFKLLFVGNLIKRKGADLLPKIMSSLGNDYILYYTSGLRSNIPDNFKISNMIPLGKLTEHDLINEYNKCDALLFPTRLEGFGYCVAEAMACAKPIISSNSSSIPEIAKNMDNGFLCKVDNVDEFISNIRKLNKSEKNYLKNRKEIITKFSLFNSLNKVKQLYVS